jgi:hypothetical protein
VEEREDRIDVARRFLRTRPVYGRRVP